MLKGLVERSYKQEKYFRREFQRIGEPAGFGFSFDCDQGGKLTGKSPAQEENFAFAEAHPERFKDLGVVEHVFEKVVPAHGRCQCGRDVQLIDEYMGACECECGRWYNLFGQELQSPEYWGDGGVY